ncbi:phosphotransferase [Actinoplanes sp. NPDC049548]|uniref:phosphotransferase enzyme family protein n=1 Tax=Actinoplanes sp. NPDC049548 TaxID=3155152 RepID=UPI00341C524E
MGLASTPAELVRLGSNAIVRLPEGVIGRVGRDSSWAETSEREVRLAATLLDAGVPCVRPWRVPQPVAVEGHPVTFWAEVTGSGGPPTIGELGSVLSVLHRAEIEVDLPTLDPWGHIPERVEQAPIQEQQRHALREVLDDLRERWASARFGLAEGVIHGDAHLGNLLRAAGGDTVLLDLDSACIGPREWDLAPTGLYATSLGWISRKEYQAFVSAYGFDVTEAPTFPLLRSMRELRMTAWIAMHATESEQVAAEVAHRIACLKDPALPRRWAAR